jgi:hypothetical protein
VNRPASPRHPSSVQRSARKPQLRGLRAGWTLFPRIFDPMSALDCMPTRSTICARWYAVHTQPLRELRAKCHLENQAYEVFLPRWLKTVRHARRVTMSQLRSFRATCLFGSGGRSCDMAGRQFGGIGLPLHDRLVTPTVALILRQPSRVTSSFMLVHRTTDSGGALQTRMGQSGQAADECYPSVY